MATRFGFFRRNLVDQTETVYTVAGQTGTSSALFDRDIGSRWSSNGYDGATSLVLSFNFATATVVSGLMVLNHNLRQFRVFYDSATANTLTPDINVTQNSATFSYFTFASTTVNSLEIQMDVANTTTVAGASTTEKVLGEVLVTRELFSASANPPVGRYRQVLRKHMVRQELADGGTALYHLADKFQADIGYPFITSAFKTNLRSVFDEAVPFVFVPFGTTSAWDGQAYEVNWIGGFNFNWATDAKDTAGWTGNIRLEQTPGGIGRRIA